MVNMLQQGSSASPLWAPLFQDGQLPNHALFKARIENDPADHASPSIMPNNGPGHLFESFGDTLGKVVDGVNTIQKDANTEVEAYATGQQTEVHQVILALGKAETAMQLSVQIRNKMIEAYHEVTRMQV